MLKGRFDCTTLTVNGDVLERVWVRNRGMENKWDIVVGVYY